VTTIARHVTRLLHEDRFFDPDPAIRRGARALYEETCRLPIIAPHGHVDPQILAENAPFPEPTSLIVQPDHYILRLLYARGIPLERLLRAIRARYGSCSPSTISCFTARPPAPGSTTSCTRCSRSGSG